MAESINPADMVQGTGPPPRRPEGPPIATGISAPVMVPLSEELLGSARSLLDSGRFDLALVVAQTACEVGTERALAQAFRRRNIPDLEKPINRLLRNFNIANPQVEKFFTALTGCTVKDKEWWDDLRDSTERRNDVVHSGVRVTKIDAERALEAATSFVRYVLEEFG